MLELIYPVEDIAPSIPALNFRSCRSAAADADEIFPVIEEDGRVVGRATRQWCHNGSHLLHPVVHLHLVDRSGRIYLQKRSLKKDLMPGKWDTAVGGHVRYGESSREALIREAEEELGMREYSPVFLKTYTFTSERDSEFVFIFAAVGNFCPQPDHDEVDEGKWWTVREIECNIKKEIFTENFVLEFKMIKKDLLSLV